MAGRKLKHVTIIGVGLLGGSAALAIKADDPSVTVAGVGRRRASLQQALDLEVIDTAHLSADDVVAGTDLVILATPVGAFAQHLSALAGKLSPRAIVTDVGSTKAMVVRWARKILGPAGAFVGSHPMAGSEAKGVAFARADLFAGATCIVTPTRKTPVAAVRRVEDFWQRLRMRTVCMTPAAHDRAAALISHLPHVLAALLMQLPGKRALDLAASGYRDATRLAGGDPEMWRDILLTNRRAVLSAIDAFDEDLMVLRDRVELGDARGIERLLASAKKRRDATIARKLSDRRLALE